jgi:hypothetical protein
MPEEWRKTFLRLQSRHDSESANASYKEFTQMFVSAQANIIDQSVLESDKVRSKLGFATTDLVFRATAPCRIVDTRNVGGPIVAGTTRNFYYYSTIGANSWAGQGGQPGSSVSACPGTVITSQGGYLGSAAPRAAALTITAVNTTAAGNFVVWGGQGPPPTSSVLNWTAGQVIADTVPVPWGGEISGALDFAVRYNGPSGQADVVVDVIGYFTVNWATALECVDTALVTTPISAGNLGEAVSPACPSTYTIVGGSCLIAGGGWLNNSRRTVNGWGCEAYGVTADFVSANARCCRVPGQ